MPPSSLVRFSDQSKSGDQNLYWSRVAVGADNLPFRGSRAPMYGDEEFEDRTVRVADARNAFFDVGDFEANQNYLGVLERCYNGWFHLVHLERFWTDPSGRRTTYHYVEWVEYYLEDGSRTPFLTPGIAELSHGQALLGNSGIG